jgi:hypothetical protein
MDMEFSLGDDTIGNRARRAGMDGKFRHRHTRRRAFGWRAASGRRAAARLDDDDDDEASQFAAAVAKAVRPAWPAAGIPPGVSPPACVIIPGIKEASPRGTSAIVLAIAQDLLAGCGSGLRLVLPTPAEAVIPGRTATGTETAYRDPDRI